MENSSLKIYRPSTPLVYLDIFVSLVIVAGTIFPLVAWMSILLKTDLVIRSFPALLGGFIGVLAAGRTAWTLRSITVSNHAISGKRYFAVGRVGFPVKEINRKKSRQRTFIQKFFGTQLIESVSGAKIVFYRRIFKKDDVNEILAKCNLNEPSQPALSH